MLKNAQYQDTTNQLTSQANEIKPLAHSSKLIFKNHQVNVFDNCWSLRILKEMVG